MSLSKLSPFTFTPQTWRSGSLREILGETWKKVLGRGNSTDPGVQRKYVCKPLKPLMCDSGVTLQRTLGPHKRLMRGWPQQTEALYSSLPQVWAVHSLSLWMTYSCLFTFPRLQGFSVEKRMELKLLSNDDRGLVRNQVERRLSKLQKKLLVNFNNLRLELLHVNTR